MAEGLSEPTRERRRYDSPLRRQRAATTKERIVAAGAELLHASPVWNWRALTVPRVAERAGVNERTVYRHFANERALREAVLARLEAEAGVDLDGLGLENLRELTARLLAFVSSFPLDPRTPRDPILLAAHGRQRDALRRAVAANARGWPDADRALAAAMLDVLWSVGAYERLVADWDLDPADAIRGVTWVMGLVEDAIREDRRPDSPAGRTPGRRGAAHRARRVARTDTP
ncbi:MAG: helix-turn-helix domain-containing protein [Acidimicrobiia bacterium]